MVFLNEFIMLGTSGGLKMKKTVIMAAVAGLASGAAAQTASLSIVASQKTVDTTLTTSFTLSVYAESSIGTHVTGAAFNINGFGSNIDQQHDRFERGLGWAWL